MYQKIIERLQKGEQVKLRPAGNSMRPRIVSKQEITLAPLGDVPLKVGDVVLAHVAGRYYIHLLSAIDKDRVQISNNHGHVNGWTNKARVYGRVLGV